MEFLVSEECPKLLIKTVRVSLNNGVSLHIIFKAL